jgi:ribonuclease Z
MADITILGTANAVPDKNHENTHLWVDAGDRKILIDCAGNPIVRLEQAGIDPRSVTDVILTHFHPDHVSGLPLLLLDLWLLERKDSLHIYGLNAVIDRIYAMMNLYDWGSWEGFYPVVFHRLPDNEQMPLMDLESIKIWASPLCHSIPSIGLRLQFPTGTLCYSSDTAPCEALVKLAEGVTLLIHEATGEGTGHTSPEEAGEIAQRAGTQQLVLIHYPPGEDLDEWVRRAETAFDSKVIAARDFMTFSL